MQTTPVLQGWFLFATLEVDMSKKHRKRTKKYHGEDAAAPVPSEPIVHRYSAVERGKVGQWWYEHKTTTKTIAKTSAIILVVLWLLFELLRLVF